MKTFATKNKDKVIDLLAERLCFERASVKLYEKVMERMARAAAARETASEGEGDYTTYGLSGYGSDVFRGMHRDIGQEQGASEDERRTRERERRVVAEMVPRVKAIQEQEQEHRHWLEDRIRELGGDARARTELARLSAREMKGIEAVVAKDPELPHLLHALLAAEHVDSAGWDLLAVLAAEAGDLEAKSEFEERLHQEERHLAFLREALRSFTAQDVLDAELEAPPMPHAP
ncbi:DUF892 family protein [Anaeromyxobacter oryzisoli]|uniref:DUF892 family protein n=1 Tax=Anaeromyxobacter oryzisoli TaxID=2925408 RepID=UPI001F572501|nr:DUF892 family protein [Anaeromyxobacter sp. SG63]